MNDAMISNIDLNPQGSTPDIVNVFMLFRINSLSKGNYRDFRNGLFGHHNGGWDKLLCFKSDGSFRVSGVSGANLIEVTSSGYQTRAMLSDLKKFSLRFGSLERKQKLGRSREKFCLGQRKKVENLSCCEFSRSNHDGFRGH